MKKKRTPNRKAIFVASTDYPSCLKDGCCAPKIISEAGDLFYVSRTYSEDGFARDFSEGDLAVLEATNRIDYLDWREIGADDDREYFRVWKLVRT